VCGAVVGLLCSRALNAYLGTLAAAAAGLAGSDGIKSGRAVHAVDTSCSLQSLWPPSSAAADADGAVCGGWRSADRMLVGLLLALLIFVYVLCDKVREREPCCSPCRFTLLLTEYRC